MKQILRRLALVLLTLMTTLAAQAQSPNPAVWCPPGATWTYGYGLWNESGVITMRYAGDTTVAGQLAQRLERTLVTVYQLGPGTIPGNTYHWADIITRVVGERVEVLAYGQFHLLYDFAAQPGSSWLTPAVTPYGPCPQTLTEVTVDSVGTQLIGGRMLRWLGVHMRETLPNNQVFDSSTRIYEQLGDVRYLQPQSPICGGTDPGSMGYLMAFQATGQPALSYDHTVGALLLPTAEARAATAGFTIFPNPSAGLVTLQLPTTLHRAARLRLLDLTGRLLRQMPVPASRQLDLAGLPAGTYTLFLDQPEQASLARRVVRE